MDVIHLKKSSHATHKTNNSLKGVDQEMADYEQSMNNTEPPSRNEGYEVNAGNGKNSLMHCHR